MMRCPSSLNEMPEPVRHDKEFHGVIQNEVKDPGNISLRELKEKIR
jgi:hypothetical protein